MPAEATVDVRINSRRPIDFILVFIGVAFPEKVTAFTPKSIQIERPCEHHHCLVFFTIPRPTPLRFAKNFTISYAVEGFLDGCSRQSTRIGNICPISRPKPDRFCDWTGSRSTEATFFPFEFHDGWSACAKS
jgi:hypothetical protein